MLTCQPVELETQGGVPVRCFAGDGLLPDRRATSQLLRLAAMPELAQYVAVLPDVHSKSRNPTPTGTVVLTRDVLIPRAIDEGTNCGMRIVRSAIPARELAPQILDQLFDRLRQAIPLKRHESPLVSREDCLRLLGQGLEALAGPLELGPEDLARTENGGRALPELDAEAIRAAVPQGVSKEARSLGTIGAGNHFLEVQEVAEILDADAALRLGVERGTATFMLHTDSRRLGKRIMDPLREEAEAIRDDQAGDLWTVPVGSDLGSRYTGALAAATHAGFANRAAVTTLLRRAVREVLHDESLALPLVCDCGHETIQHEQHGGTWYWVHRHGASRAHPPGAVQIDPLLAELGQPVPLAGCMGSDSYLALAAPGVVASFCSLPHGAGRIVEKADAARQYDPHAVEALVRARGVRLYRYDADNIAGQSPASFKDVSRVVEAMTALRMMRPVARLSPVAVLKG